MKDRELGTAWKNWTRKKDTCGDSINEGKRLFLGLFIFASLIFGLFLYFLLFLISPRLSQLNHLLPVILNISIASLCAAFIVYILLLLASLLLEKRFCSQVSIAHRVFSWTLPFTLKLGILFGISKDRISNSFIKVNNALFTLVSGRLEKKRLLVLLPRCLQYSNCNQKISEDILNCKDCGRCPVTDLIKLKNKYRVEISVATGGEMAKAEIQNLKPTGIIAIACERELISGLQEVASIPIIAIPNKRPEGPCKNTVVDIHDVESAIKRMI